MGARLRIAFAGATLAGFAIATVVACGSPALLAEGADCAQATDCMEGLVCVPGKGGTRTCSADLTGLGKVPDVPTDGGPAAADGGDGSAIRDASDGGAPPVNVPDTGPVKDSAPPPVDTGPPDTGTPPDDAAAD